MHIEQVVEQLRSMRLSVMADSIAHRLDRGDDRDLTPAQFVALLVEDEYAARRNRKLQRMIAQANFKPEQACIENLDYSPTRGLDKASVLEFTTSRWIDNAENVVVTGPTGSGKSYLAEAIGLQACKLGHAALKVRYRMLFEEIRAARGTGTYLKYLRKLARTRVLIIDDFLMQPIDQQDAGFLMDVIEEKQQLGSVVVTTQYPVDQWHHQLPDPTIADAICDRLAGTARTFNLKGDSMRRRSCKSGRN